MSFEGTIQPTQACIISCQENAKEVQIKITTCCYFTTTRVAKMKKVTSSVGRNAEQPELSYIAHVTNWYKYAT